MKKNSIFIISMLIIAVATKPSFAFSDTSTHWAKDTIDNLQEYRIVKGYEDDTFRPDGVMTRAEFVTVINRMLALKEESSKYIPDVNRADWFNSEIRKAIKAEIIQGNQAGEVCPNDNITREEAVLILSRAFKLGNTSIIPTELKDIDKVSEWAKNEVYYAIKQGFLSGYEDKTIRPQDNITRAELLTLINKTVPNILTSNVYEGQITGNTLVYSDSVLLNNLTIDGNLIISNNAVSTFKAKDVYVKKNLIIGNSENEILKNINVRGRIYEFSMKQEKLNGYKNDEYGISFSIPEDADVKVYAKNADIDYSKKDLIVMSVEQNNDFLLKNIYTLARNEIKKYDYLYNEIERGLLEGKYKYILYSDKVDNQLVVIKRDDIIYSLRFYNISSNNLVDNVLSTIDLYNTESIIDSQNVVYKNSKLSVKFDYVDKYVSVDDSYNTGKINEDKKPFKLFIQVNTITDIKDYSLSQIKTLLSSIVSKEENIKDTDVFKIMSYDSIKFVTGDDERVTYSLYVVIGNNLYNFIFKGDENGMKEIGEEMFNNIIMSLEF